MLGLYLPDPMKTSKTSNAGRSKPGAFECCPGLTSSVLVIHLCILSHVLGHDRTS